MSLLFDGSNLRGIGGRGWLLKRKGLHRHHWVRSTVWMVRDSMTSAVQSRCSSICSGW